MIRKALGDWRSCLLVGAVPLPLGRRCHFIADLSKWRDLLETQVIVNTFNTRKFFLTTWVIIKTFNHRYSRYSMGTNQSEQILAVNNWTGHTGGSRPYATLVSFIFLPWLKLKLILFF